MLIAFNQTFISKNENGAYLDSCTRHCGGWKIEIDGISSRQAHYQWYIGKSQNRYIKQVAKWPCQNCDCGFSDSFSIKKPFLI